MFSWQEGILLVLLLGAIVGSFYPRFLPRDLCYFIAAVLTAVAGIVPAKVLFFSIANPAILTVVGLWVLAKAMEKTGLFCHPFFKGCGALFNLSWLARHAPRRRLLQLACLLPLVGTCTLIGSALNLTMNEHLRAGGFPLSFFELGQIGLPCSLLAWLYSALFVPRISKSVQNGDLKREARSKKKGLAGVVVVSMLLACAGGVSVYAAVGCAWLALLLFRVLSLEEVLEAVPWDQVLLIASGLIFAAALQESGLAAKAAAWLVSIPVPYASAALFLLAFAGSHLIPPVVVLSLLFPCALAFALPIKVIGVSLIMGASVACLNPSIEGAAAVAYGLSGYPRRAFFYYGLLLALILFVFCSWLIPRLWKI